MNLDDDTSRLEAVSPGEEVNVLPSELGTGVFAKNDVRAGQRIFTELPVIQISDTEFISAYIALKDRRQASSRYAVYGVLLHAGGHLPTLRRFAQGDRAVFDAALLTEIDAAAAEAARGRGEAAEMQCRSDLVTWQSNAMQGRDYLAIFLRGCRINHSCEPNASLASARGALEVRALRDIGQGEELRVNYAGEELLARAVAPRRRALASTWGFHCLCARCVAEAAAAP